MASETDQSRHDPWAKDCPSTHCNRRDECTSPSDCFSPSRPREPSAEQAIKDINALLERLLAERDAAIARLEAAEWVVKAVREAPWRTTWMQDALAAYDATGTEEKPDD